MWFSEDIDYILWDQVISYTPAVEKENSEETAGQTEKETTELLQEEKRKFFPGRKRMSLPQQQKKMKNFLPKKNRKLKQKRMYRKPKLRHMSLGNFL